MTLSIRTYNNWDTPKICEVWNAHYAAEDGACYRMSPQQLELCCLAKPYFDANDLLVAEHDGQVVGFTHLSRLSSSSLPSPLSSESARTKPEAAESELTESELTGSELTESESTGLESLKPESLKLDRAAMPLVGLSALGVVPCDEDRDIALALLEQAEQAAIDMGAIACRFKPIAPDVEFYLGMGPGDSMIGLTASEQRTYGWLDAAGYTQVQPMSLWEMELTRFRVPMDRKQIQIRRAAHVDRQIEEPVLPWHQACILGHTEPMVYQLTDRIERRILTEVLTWTVMPELQTIPEQLAWLWPFEVDSHDLAVDRLVFLLAEMLRAMQADGMDMIRAVSPADQSDVLRIFKRLGFALKQSGVVLEKRLG